MEEKKLTALYVSFFLFHYSVLMVIPAITDITMSAVCPAQLHCSLAIYLSGIQHVVIGLGTLVMMPLIGNLSDKYGRKALLTLPMTLNIVPLAILAYDRSRSFFYAYSVLKTLTGMICEGSVLCLALAYVADNVPKGRRTSAFGVLSGIGSSAFVCGTFSSRFLSTSTTFQVATFVAIVAATYMRIFLLDSVLDENLSVSIISRGKVEVNCSGEESVKKISTFKRLPSLEDTMVLLKSSSTLSQAAIVMFFSNLANHGLDASVMYYLKARFNFIKDQFADIMVIAGISGTISQLLLMPTLAHVLGEQRLLATGLFFGCAQMFLFGIAWSPWVPYVAVMFSILYVFSQPCLRSIVSKQVGSCEQGKAQGFISGICAFASVISPLVFSPLTALFLSERAPFNFPGFSIICVGFVGMIAFMQTSRIRLAPPISRYGDSMLYPEA